MTILPQPCPACGWTLNWQLSPLHSIPPKPRDLTICGHCSTILEFDEHFRLRVFTEMDTLTTAELAELHALQSWGATHRKKAREN